MTRPAGMALALSAVMMLTACGGHGHAAVPAPIATPPAPKLAGWHLPDLPGTVAPQAADPASVRARMAQYETPLPQTSREASGVVKHLPDDTVSVHGTYPTPGFYDFRVSTPFDAQSTSQLNITGTLNFSGPLTGRYVEVGLVNNATYNYAMDPDGNPLTSDANPSYLFNQNVLMLCATDTSGTAFAAPFDYNNSSGIGPGQTITGTQLKFNLQLQPSGNTGGTVSLAVNGGPFSRSIVYGTNNWGWWPAESFAQARLVVQVYSYDPSATPFAVSFTNVLADDPNYTPPPPGTDWVHTWGNVAIEEIISTAIAPGGYVDAVGNSAPVSDDGHASAFIEQYSADGKQRWVRTWDGGGDQGFLRARTDTAGNIYVLGSAGRLIKVNNNGDLIWSKCFFPPGSSENPGSVEAWDLVADSAENVYVELLISRTTDPGDASSKSAILKLDPAGRLIASAVFRRLECGNIDSLALVGGVLYCDAGGGDASFLMKFDTNLTLLERRRCNMDMNRLEINAGNGSHLLIAGPSGAFNSNGLQFGYIVDYNSASSSVAWARRIDASSFFNMCYIATDASSNVFVCGGDFAEGGSNRRLFAAALDSTGKFLSAQKLDYQPMSRFFGEAGLATTPDGSVYVGGYAFSALGCSWVTCPMTVSDASIQFQPVEKPIPVPLEGVWEDVPGVLGFPVGVSDVGGGEGDALVARHLLPNIPHSAGGMGPIRVDCTALPNARFTVWDPVGPTAYTGSLSTNSVFDASHTLFDGDKFYVSLDVDPALAPDDLAAYPARPDGTAGGYVTVTPYGLVLSPSLATWFAVPNNTNTLQLKTGAYSRVTNDLAAGLPDALYTLRDTATNATIGGPWQTDDSPYQHILLANTTRYRPVFSAQAYPVAGSSGAHGGAGETVYPSEWTQNWFQLQDGVISEQGDSTFPSMGDYFTQSGLTNRLDADAFMRIQCAAGLVQHAPYAFQLSPAYMNVSPFLQALPQPLDVVTLAKYQTLRCQDSVGGVTTPLLTVQQNHKLNGAGTATLNFANGGGRVDLNYLTTRVCDDPDASDPGQPGAPVGGHGPWTVPLGFLLQYGAGPWTVELDADYGAAWNDGPAGRVYTVNGSPFSATGLEAVMQTIPATQPAGTYRFALRVTDFQGHQSIYVWPNLVTLGT